MNYEQKYTEALERARKFSEKPLQEDSADIVEYIFPELKESKSEDEKMKKAIKHVLYENYTDAAVIEGVEIAEIVTWLEKQGEQKQTWKPSAAQLIVIKDLIEDKNTSKVNKTILRGMLDEFTNSHKREIDDAYLQGICDAKHEIEKQGKQTHAELGQSEVTKTSDQEPEPKFNFKVGQWIVATGKRVYLITKIDGFNVTLIDTNGDKYVANIGSLVDAHLWTIADAKDGDVLCYKDEISLYKHDIKNCTKQETTFGGFVYYCCYDGKRFITDSLYSLTEQDKTDIHPATKEQRDTFFAKMKEAGYELDIDKKELKKIESKKLDAAEVIAWIKNYASLFAANWAIAEDVIEQFKRDFEL